jgi:hypothetical protein
VSCKQFAETLLIESLGSKRGAQITARADGLISERAQLTSQVAEGITHHLFLLA